MDQPEQLIMGMDVIGTGPTNEAGKYFRANAWSWRPIHALIYELCSDLLDEQVLEGMSYNMGFGPEGQEICNEMASRFEMWMEHNIDGHSLDSSDLKGTAESRVVEVLGPENVDQAPRYNTADEHIKEWIEFLRHCGGFAVY